MAPSGECLIDEGLEWLIGAVVCSLAAYRGSNCSLAFRVKIDEISHFKSTCKHSAISSESKFRGILSHRLIQRNH